MSRLRCRPSTPFTHTTGGRAAHRARRAPQLLLALAALAGLGARSPAQQAAPVPLAAPFTHESGHAFLAPVPAAWLPDTQDSAGSRLVLLENDTPLGPAHALHQLIREQGGGAYSHWESHVLFSTSDNSDPNSNGRRYAVAWRGPAGLGADGYRPLDLRDPFAALPQGAPRAEASATPRAPAPPPDAAAAASPDGLPRVIWWYTIDALRADAVLALRNGERVMPALSAFAQADAASFENAYATASFTKTSTASMFTGLWPMHHRVLHGVLPVWPAGAELVFDLDPRFRTLASVLADAGWDTWTHLYTVHVRPGDGMLAGFRHLDLDVQGSEPLRGAPVPERLFVYEHILGAHGPYAPSAAARARLALPAPALVDPASTGWFETTLTPEQAGELHLAYLGEAADADARFAARVAWLQQQGLWEDTLLIVTADHGEAFLEHGLTQHSTALDEEMVRVPLCIRFPAGSRWATLHGQRFPQRVSLADLYPTLVELAGAGPPPYALDGKSLAPILDGLETDEGARDVHLRCSFTRPRESSGELALYVTDAVLSGPLKAQFGWRIQSSQASDHAFAQGDWIAELFDLASDPRERSDLAADRPEDFLRLMRLHAERSGPLQPRDGAAVAPVALPLPIAPDLPAGAQADEELLETLRQLGYVR